MILSALTFKYKIYSVPRVGEGDPMFGVPGGLPD